MVTLLSLIPIFSTAQKLNGTYVLSSAPEQGSYKITFTKNTFIEEKSGHVSGSYGVGTFYINGNVLYLNYLQVPKQDTSAYVLKLEPNKLNFTNLDLQVLDSDNNPFQTGIYLTDINQSPS